MSCWCSEGVHIVPDSLVCSGDSNSTMGEAFQQHSKSSLEIVALSASTVQVLETPPRRLPGTHARHQHSVASICSPDSEAFSHPDLVAPTHDLDSAKYCSGEKLPTGKAPGWRLRGACRAFVASLLDSSEDEDEEESILPTQDGGSSFDVHQIEQPSPSSGTETSSTCTCTALTSSKIEPSTSTCTCTCTCTCISPPFQLDSGRSNLGSIPNA